MTLEVMSRKRCEKCKGEGQYQYIGPGDRKCWAYCRCAEESNPAGESYEVEWIEIEVTEVSR